MRRVSRKREKNFFFCEIIDACKKLQKYIKNIRIIIYTNIQIIMSSKLLIVQKKMQNFPGLKVRF